MAIFNEIPPTAGFPLSLHDVLGVMQPGSFEEDLRAYLGLDYLRITYSGTAAFYVILEALKEGSQRKKVIIPSFVCPLLPLAIRRAGLEVGVCDIRGDSFNFDLADLEGLCRDESILAVVCVHLGGIPLDVTGIERITRRKGIFLIEDCAQSLGASYRGVKTGGLGDFSFFSFCRGKGLTIYEGGAIATSRKDYHSILERKLEELTGTDALSESLKISELFGYWIFYRPLLFWFVFSLPQLFWRLRGNPLRGVNEYFDEHFPVHRVSRFRKSIGRAELPRVEQEIEKQRRKAALYCHAFEGVEGLGIIQEQEGGHATYPYLTLLVGDAERRLRIVNQLRDFGLGISTIYMHSIGDYEYLRSVVPAGDYRGGRFLAAHSLTLSTSCFLQESQILDLAKKIRTI